MKLHNMKLIISTCGYDFHTVLYCVYELFYESMFSQSYGLYKKSCREKTGHISEIVKQTVFTERPHHQQ